MQGNASYAQFVLSVPFQRFAFRPLGASFIDPCMHIKIIDCKSRKHWIDSLVVLLHASTMSCSVKSSVTARLVGASTDSDDGAGV